MRGNASKDRKRGSGIGLLAAFCCVAVLAAAATATATGAWTFFDVKNLMKAQAPFEFGEGDNMMLGADRQFRLAGVELGMSPNKVKQLHSSLTLAISDNGIVRGTYLLNGATYSIWFLQHRGSRKAYHMRVDRSFRGLDEHEVMERLGRIYGRPSSADCMGVTVPTLSNCTFSWLGRQGIALSASLRTVRLESGDTRVDLSLNIIDTLLDGKRFRTQSLSNLRRPHERGI